MQFNGQSTQSLRSLFCAALLCCSCAAQAAIVEGLYTATVERPRDVTDPRAAAQSAAMAEVLVRVTGNRAAAIAPELGPLLGNPGRFVASFGYPSATEAQVSFLPNEIERELTAAGWPLWGAERPLSVLWIAVTDQFGDQAILTTGDLPEYMSVSEHMLGILARLREDIDSVAVARGLPWALPELATQEEWFERVADVWSYSFENLDDMTPSGRADVIVMARVRESVIGTDVEWFVQGNGLSASLPGSGIPEGINWLADSYAEQYGSAGGPRTLTLRVTGLRNFDAYARVLAYLESMTMLSDVNVESWTAGELVLSVVSRGDAQVLVRTLRLDSVLRERNTLPGTGTLTSGFATGLDLVVVPESGRFEAIESGF